MLYVVQLVCCMLYAACCMLYAECSFPSPLTPPPKEKAKKPTAEEACEGDDAGCETTHKSEWDQDTTIARRGMQSHHIQHWLSDNEEGWRGMR